jgi:PleD family two-component response regulator
MMDSEIQTTEEARQVITRSPLHTDQEGRFMKSARVLILDDESTLRTALFRLLDRKGFNVVTAQKIEEAKQFCNR